MKRDLSINLRIFGLSLGYVDAILISVHTKFVRARLQVERRIRLSKSALRLRIFLLYQGVGSNGACVGMCLLGAFVPDKVVETGIATDV